MSTFYWDYDDANGDRNIEIEVNYIYTPESTRYFEGRIYRVRGDIEIQSVYVIAVSFYNPDGFVIAHIERENMQEDAIAKLDAEAHDDVEAEVGKWGYFADKLMEHA